MYLAKTMKKLIYSLLIMLLFINTTATAIATSKEVALPEVEEAIVLDTVVSEDYIVSTD